MKPQVLLVFLTRFEESTAMLKGIAQYERSHRPWAAFLDDEARAEHDPQWLRSKKWHGVISRHTTPALLQSCAELKIPLVDLNDTPLNPGVPKIRPDNTGIGHQGAEHFMERGFRNFGFCGFSTDAWACERRDGFVEALRLGGHGCEVFDVEYPGDLTPFWDAKQTTALAAWLRRLPKPAGIMACVDMRALQVIAAAQTAGLLVPEEISVIGANNDTIRCELAYPPLSSVAPNAFQSGYHAAETLALLMSGGKKDVVMDRRIEPLGVVTRQSSDILAIDDKNVAAALSYIREHACHGISVEEVLKHAYASRSQLEKKFRRHLGRSPQAEIRRVQVAKIRQLLFETDFPLKKIAELTGFEHVEYMCVVFKRITGEAPGSYRKKVQTKSGN
ncbi:AraC family transcriptional regulator [Nibricoccus aquaticus]|uniref:AraC family transcriptional regulator n=1 Tax=Nibricoccus aquaticus TaxID=2576891 RepID=A0A290QGF0_9BACT|nr:DNA-binding transcriptional regulator [Nibricoccus aquaticus]ATC62962.1 AraC family transcriptional regulator [Nibricoccus aquaticus]